MSLFRPLARVSSPDGREWEIYTYRFRLRTRSPELEPALSSDQATGVSPGTAAYAEAEMAADVLDGILWLVGSLVRLLVRVVWDIPRSGMSVLGSDRWTVEAVTWYPQRESHLWSTTRASRDQLVAEIERQLLRGEPPRPKAPPEPRRAPPPSGPGS